MYVGLAVRDYGAGRICIHTDRMAGAQTGHGANPIGFWRDVFQWTSQKGRGETIRVGLIVNRNPFSSNRMHSFRPIEVTKIEFDELSLWDLSEFDLLYMAGLPDYVAALSADQIASFVGDGGGLIIESPDRGGENINVLSSIENLYCYSGDRVLDSLGYWTLEGVDHYVYLASAKITFMSGMREDDFSAAWSILITDVESYVTTTTTTPPQVVYDFGKDGQSEFAVSFVSAMQDGLVVIEPGEDFVSSSQSSSSSDILFVSSSSSSFTSQSSSSSTSLSSSSTSSSSSSSTSSSSSSSPCGIGCGDIGGEFIVG